MKKKHPTTCVFVDAILVAMSFGVYVGPMLGHLVGYSVSWKFPQGKNNLHKKSTFCEGSFLILLDPG